MRTHDDLLANLRAQLLPRSRKKKKRGKDALRLLLPAGERKVCTTGKGGGQEEGIHVLIDAGIRRGKKVSPLIQSEKGGEKFARHIIFCARHDHRWKKKKRVGVRTCAARSG